MTAQALAERTADQLPVAPPAGASPVMAMLSDAIQKGMSIDVIREIKAMAKEFAEDEARRAFNESFAAFKAEAITVVRNREVTDGPLKGRRYAELFSFVDAATPALSKHGLSASWSITRDEKDWIEVTCTVEHALGGKKQVSQGGPPDSGGAKNPLQARISTVTYLERATLKAALGLAERGDDDDGAAIGGNEAIDDEQVLAIEQAIEDAIAATSAKSEIYKANFLKFMKTESIGAIRAKDYRKAIDGIASTRQGR